MYIPYIYIHIHTKMRTFLLPTVVTITQKYLFPVNCYLVYSIKSFCPFNPKKPTPFNTFQKM